MPSSVSRCRTRREAGHHSVCQSSYIRVESSMSAPGCFSPRDAGEHQRGGAGTDRHVQQLVEPDERGEQQEPGTEEAGKNHGEQRHRSCEGKQDSFERPSTPHQRTTSVSSQVGAVHHACPKRTSGSKRSSQRGNAQAYRPKARSRVGISTRRTSAASRRTARPRMTPISFGGSGPESANVKKTATITAAAAKITRPECASPPIAASFGSCDRSQCSFADESRNTV